MSMLARYRKGADGFEKLLVLIEQCDKKKQDKLIALIKNEDLVWADRVRSKMLTVERVLSFPQDGLNEIFSRVPEKVLVYALHGIESEKHPQVMATFTHFKRKTIEELISGPKPKPQEIEAAFMSIFKMVRDLDKTRVISIAKLNPEMDLHEKKAA